MLLQGHLTGSSHRVVDIVTTIDAVLSRRTVIDVVIMTVMIVVNVRWYLRDCTAKASLHAMHGVGPLSAIWCIVKYIRTRLRWLSQKKPYCRWNISKGCFSSWTLCWLLLRAKIHLILASVHHAICRLRLHMKIHPKAQWVADNAGKYIYFAM